LIEPTPERITQPWWIVIVCPMIALLLCGTHRYLPICNGPTADTTGGVLQRHCIQGLNSARAVSAEHIIFYRRLRSVDAVVIAVMVPAPDR
jgi:hypothetical protein